MKRAIPFVVLAVLVALLVLGWRTGGFGLLGESREKASVPAGATPEAAPPGPGLKGSVPNVDPAADPKVFEGDPVGRLDLKRGGASVTGHVVDAATKAPIRFARVVPVLPPPEPQVAVRTGKDGAFELAGLPAGTWDVRASAPDHVGHSVTTPALVEGKPEDLGEIVLKARAPQTDGLEVRVADEGGKPVRGAHVAVTTLAWGLYLTMGPKRAGVSGVHAKDALTDDLGVARFFPLAPEKYDVVVQADGFALEPIENVVVAAGRVERLRVTLRTGLSITGTVVTREGNPVKGAYVTALSATYRGTERAMSDGNGAFTLGGLLPSTYWVFAGEPDAGTGDATGIQAGQRGVRIELKGAGGIEGRVLLADGRPAPEFTIRPWVPGPFTYAYTMSFPFKDEQGRFHLPLPIGTTNLDVAAAGAALKTVSSVKVEAGKSQSMEIRLDAAGVVKGVVTDPDGNHLADAEVFLERGGVPPVPVREQYVRTDADGEFTLSGLPSESVKVHARHVSWPTAVVTVVPAPEATAKETTIRLGRGARVFGHVTTLAGDPVANARVNLYQPQGMDLFGAKAKFTGGDGGYEFLHVTPGTWQVSEGVFEFGAQGPRKTLTLAEGDDVTADLSVAADAEATATVSGKVTVAGAPAANATVEAWDERGAGSAVAARTDVEGRYTVRGLKPGGITVHVTTVSGAEDWDNAKIAGAGQSATVDFTLGGASVRFVAVGAESRETVSGAWVTVERAEAGTTAGWANVKAQGQTANDGSYSAAGLDPGAYRVRIQATGYAARVTEPFPVGEGEAKDLGTVRLAAGAVISGRVTDEAGAPVDGAGVSVKNERGEPVFLFSMVTTGSDGRYAISGLEPGAYTVSVDARGLAPAARAVSLEGTAGATADLVLAHGGSVAALVVDGDGKPVEGARLEVYDLRGDRVTKTLTIANFLDANSSRTNADGRASVPDLVAGTYTLKATKEGMALDGEGSKVTVAPKGTENVRLVLRPPQ